VSERWVPSVWLVGVAAALAACPWFGLMSFVFGGRTSWPFWQPIAIGVAWGAIVWALMQHWVSARGWSAMHGWAAVFGATVASMSFGFLGSSTWPKADLIFKIAVNVLAVAGFAKLGLRLRRETR
jgi:hypothetical protein